MLSSWLDDPWWHVSRRCAWAVALATLVGPAWAAGSVTSGCVAAFMGEQGRAPEVAVPGVVFTSSENRMFDGKTPVPASQPVSVPYCSVSGVLTVARPGGASVIHFEMSLPDDWNGKFVFQGGGGTDGAVNSAVGTLIQKNTGDTALARRYAVVSMDSGHAVSINLWDAAFSGGSGLYDAYTAFGNDAIQRLDFAYTAIESMTDGAKDIIARYYGMGPARSYFVGCSNGGRQAVMAAKRYHDKFDGVLAGAPAINFARQAMQAAWDAQKFNDLVAGTNNKPGDVLSRSDMNAVANKIRAICDRLDGAGDGMVADVAACQSELGRQGFPANLACSPTVSSPCLAPSKVTALRNVMMGPRTRDTGASLYASWPWDPGMESGGSASITSWRSWRIASDIGFGHSIATVIGTGVLAQVATSHPDPDYGGTATGSWAYLQNYDLSSSAVEQTMNAVGWSAAGQTFGKPYEELNVPSPEDLRAFRDKGGKIITYIGSADPAVSLNDTTSWFNRLMAFDPAHRQYARLYVVPGMNHCGGGPATDIFDLFSELERWSESGVAPSDQPLDQRVVIGYLNPANLDLPPALVWSRDRTRPLCEYPRVARYIGPGAPFTNYIPARNFRCEP